MNSGKLMTTQKFTLSFLAESWSLNPIACKKNDGRKKLGKQRWKKKGKKNVRNRKTEEINKKIKITKADETKKKIRMNSN